MKIYIKKDVCYAYYYGNYLCVGMSVENYIILEKIESMIFEIISSYDELDIITEKCISMLKLNGEIKDAKEIIMNYVTNSITGKRIYTLNENERLSTNLKWVGEKGRYYPRCIEVEVTNTCNFTCPHCYKEANENSAKHINLERLDEFLSFLGNNVIKIGITGGEPTLHPCFKEIVNMISEKTSAVLTMNTNGITLEKIPTSTLLKFKHISISMYGLSNEEYMKNTQTICPDSFDRLQRSCLRLEKLGVEYTMSLIVTQEKIKNIEDYVKLAIACGAKSMMIGYTLKFGRAKYIEDEWMLSSSEYKNLINLIAELNNKYSNNISIKLASHSKKVTTEKFSNVYLNQGLDCGAGTIDWTLSENMIFRPCELFPEVDSVSFTYEEWIEYVTGKKEIVWKERLKRMCSYCRENNLESPDFCGPLHYIL